MLNTYVICTLLGVCVAYRLQPQSADNQQSTQELGQPGASMLRWKPPIKGFMEIELQDITSQIRRYDRRNVVRCCCQGTGWSLFSSSTSGPPRCHVYLVQNQTQAAKCGDMRRPRWATESIHHFSSTGGTCNVAAAEVEEIRDMLEDPYRAASQGARVTIPNSNVALTDVTDLIKGKDDAGYIRCCCDAKANTFSEFTKGLIDRMTAVRTNRCQLYGLSSVETAGQEDTRTCGDYEKPDWAATDMHHYKRTSGKACFIAATEVINLLSYMGTPPDYCPATEGMPRMPQAALGDRVAALDCPDGTKAKEVYCTYGTKNKGVYRPIPSCYVVPPAPPLPPPIRPYRPVNEPVLPPPIRPDRPINDAPIDPPPPSNPIGGSGKISSLAAAFGPVVKRPGKFVKPDRPTKYLVNPPRPPLDKPEDIEKTSTERATTTRTTTTTTTTTTVVIQESAIQESATSTTTTPTLDENDSRSESLPFPTAEEYKQFLDLKIFGQDLQQIVEIGEKVAANLNNARWSKSLSSSYQTTRFLHRPRQSSLLLKMTKSYYAEKPLQGMVVAIVGAGPGGLRFAIEASLMGAKVHVLESRRAFVRYNVMKLWAYSVEDMISIGIKDLHPPLVSGTARRIPIATLQEALLRVALAVGVKMHVACKFSRLRRDDGGEVFMETDDNCKDRDAVQDLHFHAIFDATGTRATIRENSEGDVPLIDTIRLGGSDAIGMTLNFQRFEGERDFIKRTKDDPRFKKWNPALGDKSDLSKQFARDLFNSKNVDLENWVYWRSDLSHYFVLTIGLQSLIQQGVVKSKSGNETIDERLAKCDREKLVEMCLAIAEEWNVPHAASDKSAFIQNHRGKPDIALFEFGSAKQAVNAAVILPGTDDVEPKLFGVVGDALCTPFWPQGTGANRAHYSAHLQTMTLMAAWRGDRDFEAACALADEMQRRMLAMPITGNKPDYTVKDYEAMMEKNYNGIANGKMPGFY